MYINYNILDRPLYKARKMTNNPIVPSVLTVKACENLNISSDFDSTQTKSIAQCLYDQENINDKKEEDKQENPQT